MSFLLISVVNKLGCESVNVDTILTHKKIFVLALSGRVGNLWERHAGPCLRCRETHRPFPVPPAPSYASDNATSPGAHPSGQGAAGNSADSRHLWRERAPSSATATAPPLCARWSPTPRDSACHPHRPAASSPGSVPCAAASCAETTAPFSVTGENAGRREAPTGRPCDPIPPWWR